MTAIDNLVFQTTASTSTGNIILDAATRRQTFNEAFGTGGTDVFYYFIDHESLQEWEVGTGHLSTSTTLVRDTVLASSNSGSAVNFSAGTKDVANDLPATKVNEAIQDIKGYIFGLTLSNGADATNDIDIGIGRAGDDDGATIMVLASELTKRLDAAWAVGDNNGGLDTGSIANTTYHLWLIRRSDTGVVDALFSTSATSPTMPTNYDQKRRIGCIIRSGGTILAFNQLGNEFLLSVPINDANAVSLPSTRSSVTLTTPNNIQAIAKFSLTVILSTAGRHVLLTALDQTDTAPSATVRHLTTDAGATFQSIEVGVRTNTSSQIGIRGSAAAGSTYSITTFGWTDTRGRDE